MRSIMGASQGRRNPRAVAAQPVAHPRVLHVIPTALGRGAQVFARALVDELGGEPNGHWLVSLFDGPEEVPVERTLALPGGGGAERGLHPAAVGRLFRMLRHLDPGVVVAHGGDAFKYLALATRAPIVYCVIGTWPAGPRPRLQRLFWRLLARRAWIAAAVSEDVAQECREVLALREDRLAVIPNGRDTERFRPATERRSEPPSDRGVSILFVGHLTPGKRPDRFVELVRTLRARGLPVTGKIVGDGAMRADLEGPAAAAAVGLLGWCDDVVPQMQQADIFVFPSEPEGEGMPGVLIEAGLCGLPAIATQVPGASTVLLAGQTGMLVPVDDFAALVETTSNLACDPRRRAAMGTAARLRCETTFALPIVARSWERVLQAALTGSRHDARAIGEDVVRASRTSGPR